MKLLHLALRNLFRNTRRTLITLAAIALGLSMMILTVNFQNGAYSTMIRAGISSMAGHVVIQAEGYQEERDAAMLLHDASGIVASLREACPEATLAPRIFVGGLLVSASSSVGGALVGIEPSAEARVQDLHEKVVDGVWLVDDPRAIVIGQDMAETLEVEVGDKLIYMGQNGTDEVVSHLFRVRGVYRTGSAQVDGRVAYVGLEAAQVLVGGGDVAHMVTVHLPDPDTADAVAAQARAALGQPGIAVLHWREAIPEMYAMIRMDREFGDVMLAVIGLIVAFGVLNTMMMSVLERTREFGVMLSLGMKPRQIAGLVLLEGVVLGLLGATAGLLVGLTLSWPVVQFGFDYASFTGGEVMETGGVVMDTVMRGAWDPLRMGIYYVGALVFCLGAALYPAWSIAKLQPVQALRHH